MKKVSVIGAGSWGSALAVLLANNGHEVTLWTHDPHEIEMLSTSDPVLTDGSSSMISELSELP